MIGKLEIPLYEELTVESEDGSTPEWAKKLYEEVREVVEQNIEWLKKNKNINVGILLCLDRLAKGDAEILLERTIETAIMDVMNEYGKEVTASHCSYEFFHRAKRVEIEIF